MSHLMGDMTEFSSATGNIKENWGMLNLTKISKRNPKSSKLNFLHSYVLRHEIYNYL